MTTLVVANVGGHLRQLVELVPRLELGDELLWVTNDTEQSRSLLAGSDVLWLRYPEARSLRDAYANAAHARRALRSVTIETAVSTGASLAVSVLPLAARRGADVHYIESATRIDGPSLSGKLLRWVPGVKLYSQSEAWADDRWRFRGSVFDGFEAEVGAPQELRKVVVTVGTSSFSGFRRLFQRLVELIPPSVEVLWQTGGTDVTGLDLVPTPSMPATELEQAIREADVVVAHAGTGSALTALAVNRFPVLVPRDPAHGEHVDRHQFETARRLEAAGLAATPRVEELDLAVLMQAAGTRVRRVGASAPFALDR